MKKNKYYPYKQVVDTDITQLYPNTMIIDNPHRRLKEYKTPLTKQQIFDLTFKWNLAPSFKVTCDDWWNSYSYWWRICAFGEELSEEFLREYQDRIDWFIISKNQNLSEEFIWEFKDKLNLKSVIRRGRVYRMSPDFLKKLEEYYFEQNSKSIDDEPMIGSYGYGGYTIDSVFVDENP